MSRLKHLCAHCPHESSEHKRVVADKSCRCCNNQGEGQYEPHPDGPVLIDTYDGRTHEREDVFHAPGTLYNQGTVHRQVLCDCQMCHDAAAAR